MAAIVFSRIARFDLSKIWAWIAERDGEERADLIVDRIDTRVRQLADHPELGPVRPEIHPSARSLSCDRWMVLYDIHPDGVRIIRVVDAARDLTNVWPSDPSQ